MIKLILLATLGVVATVAAPQAASTVASGDYYRNNYNNDPYYRNNYDPYNRNNYYRNDPYNRNNYDPYHRNNYYRNDASHRNNYDPYYKNNYDQYNRNNYYGNDYNRNNNYNRNNYYKNDPYNRNYNYNPEYQKNYVPGAEANARILRFESNLNPDGTYEYAYDTENGISVQEQGFPIQTANNDPAIGVTGSFSYTSPEGRPVYTRYVADDNGFRAEGNTVPQSNLFRDDVAVANGARLAAGVSGSPVVESSTSASQQK